MRLTRRGRLVVALLAWVGAVTVLACVVTALVLLVGVLTAPWAQAGSGAGAAAGADSGAVEVVLMPGDTLWGLAREYAPHRDPRAVIADIEDLNDLRPGAPVRAGWELAVPLD